MHSMTSFYGENLHISIETALEECDQGVTGRLPGRWEHILFLLVHISNFPQSIYTDSVMI